MKRVYPFIDQDGKISEELVSSHYRLFVRYRKFSADDLKALYDNPELSTTSLPDKDLFEKRYFLFAIDGKFKCKTGIFIAQAFKAGMDGRDILIQKFVDQHAPWFFTYGERFYDGGYSVKT